MEWTPDYISWSVDGHEVRHVNVDDPAVDYMRKAQSLRMNFWTPTVHSWGQGLDAADMPWYLLYDYVEVFTYNEDSKEFELHWRDDFDSFDEKRWHKASGGFDANSSVFHPENVSVKAGNLVLKMEPEEHVHYEEVHHEYAPEHHLSEHHGDRLHHLHKAEHFDREHVRGHRDAHEGRFWIENEENEKDDIVLAHHDDVDSSDSDADWDDYQRYLRQIHHLPEE
jgi:beta-glucanase (GH16 family)